MSHALRARAGADAAACRSDSGPAGGCPGPEEHGSRAGSLEAELRNLLVEVIRQEVPSIVREELRRLANLPAHPAAGTPVSEYLTAEDAGEIAGVRAATVRRWVHRGELPGHYSGRLLRVRLDELRAYLARDRGTGEALDMESRVSDVLRKLG